MAKKMVVLPVCRMGRESNKWELFDMAFPVDNILRIENICPGWSESDDDEPKSEIHFKDSEITFFLYVDAMRAADLINED